MEPEAAGPPSKTAQTTKSVAWLSGGLLLAALTVGSPAGGMMFAAIAALCALPALVLGTPMVRIVSAGLLVGGLALAATLYPQYEKEIGQMRHRRPPAAAPTPSRNPPAESAPAG